MPAPRVRHALHTLQVCAAFTNTPTPSPSHAGTYSQLESHFVQLDADLVNALKESERDMYDQRNQQLNTLILASTVMLSALTTLLIEGTLPLTSDKLWVMLFGLACGLSFALQTLCIVLCIETLRLASSFMIRRAEKLNEDLKKGREDTKVRAAGRGEGRVLHCIALHCIALHCIALHCSAAVRSVCFVFCAHGGPRLGLR